MGSMAPFTVIFDPVFALAGGFAGAVSGVLFGGAAAMLVDAFRSRMPLSALLASAAALGAVWGALIGTIGGTATAFAGSWMGFSAMSMGFVCGATSGMVLIGGLFPAYLLSSAHNRTAPVVLVGVLASPFMGWAGLAALTASTFGLWLFALPPLLWAGAVLDGSVARARLTEERASGRILEPTVT